MSKRNKIVNFLKKNGFYLCLAVCVLGVGLAVFFGTAGNGETPEDNKEQERQVQAIQSPSAKPTVKPSASVSPVAVSASPSPSVPPEVSEDTAATPKPRKNRVTLRMPLNGEITSAFSDDTLVFNSTLNMWMTHNGVDITSQSADEVVCSMAGEVSAVYSDETRGMVVEVSHANNAKTVYAGLSESGVTQGALVNAGTVLGKVGTPGFEADSGKHLHFEYMVEGKYQDPAELFTKD